MSRLMSVAFTEDAVRARIKTVTRRKGWWVDKHGRRLLMPGDTLTLCRKVMGRKPGEPLVRIAEVEVLDVRREPLAFAEHKGELALEGLEHLSFDEFWLYYFDPQGIAQDDLVTRIEWRYLPAPVAVTELEGGQR